MNNLGVDSQRRSLAPVPLPVWIVIPAIVGI